MSDPVGTQATTPVTSPSSTASTSSASAANSTAAAATTTEGYTTSSRVESLADLKKKAPKVYNAMIQGIATHICNEMKDHQERLKKLMRQASSSG